jgi:hypothetical protein
MLVLGFTVVGVFAWMKWFLLAVACVVLVLVLALSSPRRP